LPDELCMPNVPLLKSRKFYPPGGPIMARAPFPVNIRRANSFN
jgi:hypothetical protein